jgi:hypothetical protein
VPKVFVTQRGNKREDEHEGDTALDAHYFQPWPPSCELTRNLVLINVFAHLPVSFLPIAVAAVTALGPAGAPSLAHETCTGICSRRGLSTRGETRISARSRLKRSALS